MIEDEVLKILNTSSNLGVDLNALVDEFRGGRHPADVMTLLRSQHGDLVQIGAYIAGEILFEYYNTPAFLDRLRELTTHEHPMIRMNSMRALFPSFDPTKQETRDLFAKMLNDADAGVRMCAEAAAKQLGLMRT